MPLKREGVGPAVGHEFGTSPTSSSDALVTVAIPVLNGMPWLPEAVESVRAQPGPIELIVCDGGSQDGSREWLERELSGTATLLFERDAGQADAIRRAFRAARSGILCWLNADDVFENGALKAVREEFDRQPDAVGISGGCLVIDEKGRVTGSIPLPTDASLMRLLRTRSNLAQPATFFRASAYHAAGGITAELHYAMDVDLWLKLARVGRIVLMPDVVLARFRLHAGAKTSRSSRSMIREDLRVRRRHGLPLLTATTLDLVRKAYGPRVRRRVAPLVEALRRGS